MDGIKRLGTVTFEPAVKTMKIGRHFILIEHSPTPSLTLKTSHQQRISARSVARNDSGMDQFVVPQLKPQILKEMHDSTR